MGGFVKMSHKCGKSKRAKFVGRGKKRRKLCVLKRRK